MTRRLAAPALLSLAALGSLAGCASPAPAVETPTSTPSAAPSSAPAATQTPTAAAEPVEVVPSTVYADGTYRATGQYIAPSGPETVDVTLTIAEDLVTAVEVVGHATDGSAQDHQADFIGGVGELVVGRPLADLAVHRVAGSSLTSGGFNSAVDQIRAEALR